MSSYEFWEEWKKRTPLEDAAIRSLTSARERILSAIPNDEIISIYAKGSLIRRELTPKSDVDTLTIVKRSRWLRTLMRLHRTNRLEPAVCYSGYSLWELERNARSKSGKPDRGSPVSMLAHLGHYKLIYGTPIEPDAFGHVIDKHARLRSMAHAFRSEFIPCYDEGSFAFTDLVKQTFWLAEKELSARGEEAPHHWGALAERFPETHIVHDALKLRMHPTKRAAVRASYVKKLRAYLDELERTSGAH